MAVATIHIRGAWATLDGAPLSVLASCLSFDDPKRFMNPAFRAHRWDGKVKLFAGFNFPHGFVDRVYRECEARGFSVRIMDHRESVELPPDQRVNPNYLAGLTLWDHQVEAIGAVLRAPRGCGVLHVPTRGGKTAIAAYIAKYCWETYNWRTLIFTARKGIAGQTYQKLSAMCPDIEIGQIGDGKKFGGRIISATAPSLLRFEDIRKASGWKRADPLVREAVTKFEVIIADECHRASSTSWFNILMSSNAKLRIGMSGTPLQHKEISDMRLLGAVGPIIYRVLPETLIAKGLIRPPKIVMVMSRAASGPSVTAIDAADYRNIYEQGVVFNEFHNRAVLRAVEWLTDRGRRVFIPCRRKDHFDILSRMLTDSGISHAAVWGETPTEVRNEAKRKLAKGIIKAILATEVFSEGEDLPSVDAIVLAEGVKTPVPAIQRVGRGLQTTPDGPAALFVVDIVPTSHPVLTRHGYSRALAYEREGYETVLQESWPKNEDETLTLPFEVADPTEKSDDNLVTAGA